MDMAEMRTFVRPTVFAGFGAISFAFVCQQSSFLVYRSMSDGTVQRWAWVSRWALTIALAMGTVLALGGFLHFGQDTEGNILNNFSTEHKPASVARGFLAVTMVREAAATILASLGGDSLSPFLCVCVIPWSCWR